MIDLTTQTVQPLQGHVGADHSGVTSDLALVALWLATRARSAHTVRAYQGDALSFLGFIKARGRVLQTVKLVDLVAWIESLHGSDNLKARKISTIKSLLSFGHRSGYLTVNIGAACRAPKPTNCFAERMLAESSRHCRCHLDWFPPPLRLQPPTRGDRTREDPCR